MKKTKLLTLLVVPFLLAGCGDKKDEQVQRNPKSETRYDAENKIMEKNEYNYDNGKLVQILSTFYEDEIASKWKTVLNYSGDLLVSEKAFSFADDAGNLKFEGGRYYSYDEKGNETVFVDTSVDKSGEENVNNVYFSTYNDKNLVAHCESYMATTDSFILSMYTDYEYNEKGLKISEKTVFAPFVEGDPAIQHRNEYTYNTDDTLKEMKEYNGYLDNGQITDEELDLITYYSYDSNKNLTSEIVHGFDDSGNDVTKIKEIYEYDDKNRLVKSSYFHRSDDETVTDLVLDYYSVYEY